jgi:hypothetical protein
MTSGYFGDVRAEYSIGAMWNIRLLNGIRPLH